MPAFNTRFVAHKTHNPDLSANAKTLLQTGGAFGMTIEGVPVPKDWYRLRNNRTGEEFYFPENVDLMPRAINLTLPYGLDDAGKPCRAYCDTSTGKTDSSERPVPNEYNIYARRNNPNYDRYRNPQWPYGADESVSEGANCAVAEDYFPQIGRYEFTSLCKGFNEVRNPVARPAQFGTNTVIVAAVTPVGTILLLILGIWFLIRCYKAIKAEWNNSNRVQPTFVTIQNPTTT